MEDVFLYMQRLSIVSLCIIGGVQIPGLIKRYIFNEGSNGDFHGSVLQCQENVLDRCFLPPPNGQRLWLSSVFLAELCVTFPIRPT